MKKRMYYALIVFALTAAGVTIGLLILWEPQGKQLTFSIMTIVSLYLSSFLLYYYGVRKKTGTVVNVH